ncbi:MAG: zinc transporter 9 [Chlamydiales bacterium]|jgi:zinc transporter 9
MAGSSSTSAVLFALVGNAGLTVLKFVAFGISGSGAMLSEAVHSFADTGNQGLLYLGIKRSERPADAAFHYGFGADRFFYSLMSAVGIFVLGCGVTLYHGVHSLLHPPELHITALPFVVLGISLVVDGYVLRKAVHVVNERRGDEGFLRFLRTSSDPTLAAVLLEDGVACVGVLVAMLGIILSQVTGSHLPDVMATFLIGGMMGGIAIWLGLKNKALILGPSIPKAIQQDCLAFMEAQDSVEHVRVVRTRIVGADRFNFAAEVDWNGRALGEPLADWVGEQLERLTDPEERRAFAREFGEKVTEALGDEIDRIESELRERHPELTILDLESD